MNCKPGDLAIVVAAAMDTDWRGKIVRCIRLDPYNPHPGLHFWEVENAPIMYGREVVFDDDLLRPLRDPGDDAKDEMARPLPKEVCA